MKETRMRYVTMTNKTHEFLSKLLENDNVQHEARKMFGEDMEELRNAYELFHRKGR